MHTVSRQQEGENTVLHVDDAKVRSLLFKGNFGLEKESLRIHPDGTMSHSPDPFKSEKNIVRDFCENQTEINTDVERSPEEAVQALYEHTRSIQRRLKELMEPELIWPFSNPPYIKNEDDIPIAEYEGPAASKTEYRRYLSDRYGRYKMTLSGIHVNFSFADELLEADFRLSGMDDFQEYKNALYLRVAENATAYGWIITALTAASPLLDSSYFEKGVRGRTTFNGMASTRCSELGYWNYFTPLFDYSSVSGYADSIQKYVDQELIIAPSELYFPVRLKPRGENSLEKLHDEGVSHIELRMVDLNPLCREGINIDDLRFIHLLLIWLACNEPRCFGLKQQVQAAQNFKSAAHYDLKTVKIVTPCGAVYSVAHAGRNLIDAMRRFYEGFSDEVMRILDYEYEKLVDPEKRYAWIIRKEFADSFLEKGLELAIKRQQEAL